ncbi:MAG: Mor transcription activator family protein [Paraclostridium sp.]
MRENELIEFVEADDLPNGCRDLVEVVGMDVVIELIEYSGGGSLYFPSKRALCINARNRIIRKSFNGGNYKELSNKFGISTVQVRNVVHQ